jgi:hypothetical protein
LPSSDAPLQLAPFQRILIGRGSREVFQDNSKFIHLAHTISCGVLGRVITVSFELIFSDFLGPLMMVDDQFKKKPLSVLVAKPLRAKAFKTCWEHPF